MTINPAIVYEARKKRVMDAVQLVLPDRVPFMPVFNFFQAGYGGITCEEAMYDHNKLVRAAKKTIMDFEPDMYASPFAIALGQLLDILECKYLMWPGRHFSAHQPFQFVEGEYMRPEEYEDLIFDPTGFMLRQYLPRVYGALAPFEQLPVFPAHYYTRFLTSTAVFADSALSGALQTLTQAGRQAQELLRKAKDFAEEMTALGYPCQSSSVAHSPFDYLGDHLRGTRGIMLDMYRRPNKLLEAMEKLLPFILHEPIAAARRSGVPFVFIPLHKGIDGFMSLDQFRTFYWPPLQKMILNLIENDLVPVAFWEGDCTSRLPYIADIPRGKAIYWFEQTDIFRAKKILGETVCIRGNVPASLLCVGSPAEVMDYCKRLIDIVGHNGGFILDGGVGIPDEAKPENVRAMVDAVNIYGIYN